MKVQIRTFLVMTFAFTIIALLVAPASTGQTRAPDIPKAAFVPTFADSGQNLGDDRTFGLASGDIDGDGDIDVLVSNYLGSSTVLTNDGHGMFNDSGQGLGTYSSHGVELGDFDNDGDLDAFTVHQLSGSFVFVNDGTGVFDSVGPLLGTGEGGISIALGDVDRDLDLDFFIGMVEGFGGNRLYLCTIPRETVRKPSGRVAPQ